jgi:hypothetical protein
MAPHLTTRQASKYLKIQGTPFTEKTLEVWRHQSRGPQFKRIGRRVFYTKKALDQFIEGETVDTVDSAAR